MPHNNFWSLDSEQTSSRGLPSCREGNLASWGSESDGSNHTAAISLHPCSSVSSSHGQNQNHAHPCDRKKQQKHDQPSLQQLQVKHSQIIPKQQQQYLSNTHGQDKKLIYATSDHQQDKSLSVGINGNGNSMRASNSSTKMFPNNQNFIVTAGQTMQNNRKGILYLGYQNMDSPSEKGSYTPEPDVGQQQKPHVQQQHQQLATTNLSQGLQSSTSLDEGEVFQLIFISIFLPFFLFVYLHPSVCGNHICQFASACHCPPTYLFVFLSLHSFLCVFVSICLNISLYIHLFFFLSSHRLVEYTCDSNQTNKHIKIILLHHPCVHMSHWFN